MTPVTWTPKRGITAPALAVPCTTCGAYIGRACTTWYSSGHPREPHRQRGEQADAYGFTWAPGAQPAHHHDTTVTPPPGAVTQGQGALAL